MTGLAIDFSTDRSGLDRRSKWLIWFTRRLLSQDLTAEDRIAILGAMLGREMAMYPRQEWPAISTALGHLVSVTCIGAADAKADAELALRIPAGHG